MHNHAGTADAKLRALVDSAPDAIICVDELGTILLFNSEAERMLGYRREELIGQPVEILVPQRVRGEHTTLRQRYVEAPRTRPIGGGLDLTARRKDGTEVPVLISLSSMPDGAGQWITCILRDVTERRRAEAERAQLLESERIKSEQLTFSVREAHHRIKNNLQAVSDLISLELLQAGDRKLIPVETLRASIERIQTIALVHDFLSKDTDVRTVDIHGVLSALVPMVLSSTGIDPNKVQLTLAVPPIVLSSKRATALALIVNELVSNAVKHAFRKRGTGMLQVSLHQDSEELVLRVSDDGPGLPPGFDLDRQARVGLDVVQVLAQRDLEGSFKLYNRAGTVAEVRFSF